MGYQQTFIPPRSRFFLSFASVKPTPHPPIHHPTPTTSHLYHPPLHPSACAFFFFTFLTFIAPLRTPLSHFLASFVTLVLSFFSSSGSFSGRLSSAPLPPSSSPPFLTFCLSYLSLLRSALPYPPLPPNIRPGFISMTFMAAKPFIPACHPPPTSPITTTSLLLSVAVHSCTHTHKKLHLTR